LDESRTDRLGNMSIVSRAQEGPGPVTTLVGRLRDQAELNGVLNTLYEMHLKILSVDVLPAK
jgi:hypothetical protein